MLLRRKKILMEQDYLFRVVEKLEAEHQAAVNAWKTIEGRPALYYTLKGRVSALFLALTIAQNALSDYLDYVESDFDPNEVAASDEADYRDWVKQCRP